MKIQTIIFLYTAQALFMGLNYIFLPSLFCTLLVYSGFTAT